MAEDPRGAGGGSWSGTGSIRAQTGEATARPVQASLLDRLTELDPGATRESQPTRAESVIALRAAVKHDLEWLLNSRRDLVTIDDGMPEARRSLLRYGVPDFSSMSRDGSETLQRLVREVEDCVANFEPRLAHVRVRAHVDPGMSGRPDLRFSIEGMLRVDPAPEHVVYDTVLETGRGEYVVHEGKLDDA
jgi:type VI secretion system protein ImpF